MTARPIDTAELAERLGLSRDRLYRKGVLEALYAEGMPRPISTLGHRRWERNAMLAWLGRHHPAMATPANDAGPPPPDPAADDVRGWQARLAGAYGRN